MATSMIKTDAPAIRVIDYGCYVTTDFDARGHGTITASAFGIQPVEGYTPLCIKRFSINTEKIDITWVNVTTSGGVMGLCTANQTGVTDNFSVYVSITWVRNDLVGT